MKLILILFLAVATYAQRQEYCDPALCNNRANIHIGCPGVAVNNCPSDVKVMNMDEHKDWLVRKLNGFRHVLAGGEYAHLPPATRMAEVKWDDELSYLATINARQCRFGHDQCRNTVEYPYSGQNLYASSGIRNGTENLERAFNLWWNEYTVTTASDIASYPR